MISWRTATKDGTPHHCPLQRETTTVRRTRSKHMQIQQTLLRGETPSKHHPPSLWNGFIQSHWDGNWTATTTGNAGKTHKVIWVEGFELKNKKLTHIIFSLCTKNQWTKRQSTVVEYCHGYMTRGHSAVRMWTEGQRSSEHKLTAEARLLLSEHKTWRRETHDR